MSPSVSNYYAHSGEPKQHDLPNSDWQLLVDHLRGVAERARTFAERTGIRDRDALSASAHAAGLLHDLGKYRRSFQEYIRDRPPRGPKGHKQAGAVWACDAGHLPLVLAILGHHGGMPDLDESGKQIDDEDNGRPVFESIRDAGFGGNGELAGLEVPAHEEGPHDGLFTRLLFSCLVDADWTDTGEYERLRSRNGWAMLPEPSKLDPERRLETWEPVRESPIHHLA